jgi:hypothetical protein
MFDMLFSTGASLVLANFRQILILKYDFDLYKLFFMEKWPKFTKFPRNYFPSFQILYDKFQVGSQEYIRIPFFKTFI